MSRAGWRAGAAPVPVTAALAILAVLAALPPVRPHAWPLTWLLLGLIAGYALSGSV